MSVRCIVGESLAGGNDDDEDDGGGGGSSGDEDADDDNKHSPAFYVLVSSIDTRVQKKYSVKIVTGPFGMEVACDQRSNSFEQ